MHSHAGYFVDADEHGFAGFPGGCVVFCEVPGQLVEAFARGDDVVGAFEFSLEVLFFVDVADFGFFQFFGDAFVQIIDGDDVVALGVAFVGVYVLVEFLDEGEDV